MKEIQDAVRALTLKHGGLRAAARVLDVTPAYLSRLGNGHKKNPSTKILRKLGLARKIVYEQRP